MKLYDTLTGQKRDFAPLDGKTVRMYVCGITPYSSSHVGHAFSVCVFDVLRRYLEFLGYEVLHVQNFTDIDDKIIQRSQQEGVPAEVLAQRYIDEYLAITDALNVKRAVLYPRATGEVERIVQMVQALVEKGYAYAVDGDVYYRVQRFQEYGKLSHRSLEGMMAGARVEVDPRKEHPMDFALWKAAKPGEPAWPSPWGPGRPGWHIECSAMSLAYLGSQIDIHGGGQDLVFPHHENEIAQSEAATGVKPFVRFWVHNAFLTLGESKMSKSVGNLVTARELLQRFTPDAIRLFFASSHYRTPLAFSEEGLTAMERAAERLRFALREAPGAGPALDPAPFRQRFLEAMDDDLNTPQALAALFDLTRETNRAREQGQDVREAQATLRLLAGDVLGLSFRGPAAGDGLAADALAGPLAEIEDALRQASQQELAERVSGARARLGDAQDAGAAVQTLVEVRGNLRKARQFALADTVRDRLAAVGVVLEDTPRGTEWRYRPPSG